MCLDPLSETKSGAAAVIQNRGSWTGSLSELLQSLLCRTRFDGPKRKLRTIRPNDLSAHLRADIGLSGDPLLADKTDEVLARFRPISGF